jgi:hypothetical protein
MYHQTIIKCTSSELLNLKPFDKKSKPITGKLVASASDVFASNLGAIS